MPRHLLDEVLDARTSAAPVPLAAAAGWTGIPPGCSCTWRPDYSTMPATWTRAGVLTTCKVHGSDEDGDKT